MKTLIQTLTLSVALVSLTSTSFAGNFREKHPRRAEVNHRVRNQAKRIHEGVKTGEMTPEEAKMQRENLRAIKKEERTEVKANGGHLTKEQTKDLNQKLNENSKQIHDAKHNETKTETQPQ